MSKRCEIMFVSSAGGHLAQLLRLQEGFDGAKGVVVTERTPASAGLGEELQSLVLFLPHGGREAPVSFVWKFSWNVIISAVRLLWLRPAVVISTGAHTAVPTCMIGKLFGAKVIYIESFARIRSPSLTGRILYPIVDRFYVQWPELKQVYKRARYEGKLY